MENTHWLRPFGLEINDLECGGWEGRRVLFPLFLRLDLQKSRHFDGQYIFLWSAEDFWRADDTRDWVDSSRRKAFVHEGLITYCSGGVVGALQLKWEEFASS
jgi:hypothetical protein